MGWFLLGAAEAELETAEARDALAGLTVADAMVRDPVTVDADASVQAFMDEVFVPTRHIAFPVMSDGRAVGIVSFRRALTLPAAAWPSVRVREIMVPAAEASADAETPLSEALLRLAMGEVRRLLVCRDGRLMGLLSLTDAARLAEVRGIAVGQARFEGGGMAAALGAGASGRARGQGGLAER